MYCTLFELSGTCFLFAQRNSEREEMMPHLIKIVDLD